MADSLKRNPITSCTITWTDCGHVDFENVLCVKTRILPDEIQVRFYNGHGLLHGSIWPMSKQQSRDLFGLLEQCNDEWTSDDYSVFVCDGSSWQLKLSFKGRRTRTIRGTVDPPPHGQEIWETLAGIIGDVNCYFFDPEIDDEEEDPEMDEDEFK